MRLTALLIAAAAFSACTNTPDPTSPDCTVNCIPPTIHSDKQTQHVSIYVVLSTAGGYVNDSLIMVNGVTAAGPSATFTIPADWTTVEIQVTAPGFAPYDAVRAIPKAPSRISVVLTAAAPSIQPFL